MHIFTIDLLKYKLIFCAHFTFFSVLQVSAWKHAVLKTSGTVPKSFCQQLKRWLTHSFSKLKKSILELIYIKIWHKTWAVGYRLNLDSGCYTVAARLEYECLLRLLFNTFKINSTVKNQTMNWQHIIVQNKSCAVIKSIQLSLIWCEQAYSSTVAQIENNFWDLKLEIEICIVKIA